MVVILKVEARQAHLLKQFIQKLEGYEGNIRNRINHNFLLKFQNSLGYREGRHILWITYRAGQKISPRPQRGKTGSRSQLGTYNCSEDPALAVCSADTVLGPQQEGPFSCTPCFRGPILALCQPCPLHKAKQTSTHTPRAPSRQCSAHLGPWQSFCSVFISLPLPTILSVCNNITSNIDYCYPGCLPLQTTLGKFSYV